MELGFVAFRVRVRVWVRVVETGGQSEPAVLWFQLPGKVTECSGESHQDHGQRGNVKHV